MKPFTKNNFPSDDNTKCKFLANSFHTEELRIQTRKKLNLQLSAREDWNTMPTSWSPKLFLTFFWRSIGGLREEVIEGGDGFHFEFKIRNYNLHWHFKRNFGKMIFNKCTYMVQLCTSCSVLPRTPSLS